MQYFSTTPMAALGLLAVCCASSAAEETNRPIDQEVGSQTERPLVDHPYPELELTSFEGELCRPEAGSFDPITGGMFRFTTFAEPGSEQHCQLDTAVTIPAGYRFRRPLLTVMGSYLKFDESTPAATVELSYKLGDGPQLTSRHSVEGAIFPAEDDSFTLTDTPKAEASACGDLEEPSVVPFQVHVAVSVPTGTMFHLTDISGNFHLGSEWFECDETPASAH